MNAPKKGMKGIIITIVISGAVLLLPLIIVICVSINNYLLRLDSEKAVSLGEEKLDLLKEYVLENSDAFKEISELCLNAAQNDNDRKYISPSVLMQAGRDDLVDVLNNIPDMGLWNYIEVCSTDSGDSYVEYTFRTVGTRHYMILESLYYIENGASYQNIPASIELKMINDNFFGGAFCSPRDPRA